MKLLIADDSEAKILMLRSLLEQYRFPATVLVAKTTDEAIALIDDQPDIAFGLIDYEIPSANGPAVIRHLKERNPHARIMLCTAYCGDAYKQEALAAGAEAYICTSENMEEIAKEMKERLEKWKHRK